MENSATEGGEAPLETPLKIRHAYLAGGLVELRSLSHLLSKQPESNAMSINVISNRIKELEEEAANVVILLADEGKHKEERRHHWQIFKINGGCWISDRFAKVGDFKISLYWQLEIEQQGKKNYTCILPPSLPIFVGNASDPPGDITYNERDWIKILIDLVRDKLYEEKSKFGVRDLIRVIEQRKQLFDGLFYLDFKDTERGRVWTAHWCRKSHKHRELPSSEPSFLMEILKKIESLALREMSPQQIWDWLDYQEMEGLGIAITRKWDGYKVMLAPYRENDTISWRLNYKRNPKRLPRWRAKAVSDLIKASRFDEIEELRS